MVSVQHLVLMEEKTQGKLMLNSVCPIMGLIWPNQWFLFMYKIWFEFKTQYQQIAATSEAEK